MTCNQTASGKTNIQLQFLKYFIIKVVASTAHEKEIIIFYF